MTIQKSTIYLVFMLLSVAVAADSGNTNKVLHVVDPYARAASKVMKNGAAYMVLHNHGTRTVVLTGVRSEVAARSMLHQSKMANGLMKMLPVDKLAIAPGAVVQLRPGGYHIMLMGLKHELKEGSHFALSLQFSDGSEQRIEVPVRGMGAMPMPVEQHQHQTQGG